MESMDKCPDYVFDIINSKYHGNSALTPCVYRHDVITLPASKYSMLLNIAAVVMV